MSNNKYLSCPFCNCIFFHASDLERHLNQFRIAGAKPNAYDHKIAWRLELERREKIEKGFVEE